MKNKYDDPHIVEIYDRIENEIGDVELIKRLIKPFGRVKILEPFCGSGRILVPLAKIGHRLIGIDQSGAMLDKARFELEKSPGLDFDLIHADVFVLDWSKDNDLVILGCNCFTELSSSDLQEQLIRKASQSLKKNGYLYIENDNMEGDLSEDWQKVGVFENVLSGKCKDGAVVKTRVKVTSFDVKKRLWRAERVTIVELRDGDRSVYKEKIQDHPASAIEIEAWLNKYGFHIEGKFSSTDKSSYYPNCPRAIFWSKKIE